MAQQPSNFRYDINGLRAIAILGVLLFHYKLTAFDGGFAGVDVFFVISGYLMSRTVMGQVEKGSFEFWTYFERRLHRIVPALLFLVAFLALLCFFIYFPADYTTTLENGASSIFFVSNIFYWLNAPSYFDAATDTNMFLHTWSLSVEWQFYLIYPFVLLLLNRLFKNRHVYRAVFTGLVVVSFVAALLVSKQDMSASFYLLPTRAWEMLFGGLAFFAEGLIKGKTMQRITAVTGYVMVLASFFLFNDALPWPGFYTLLPVVGTWAIIVANYNNFWFIRLRAFQFTGKISYSLYLWHWPVFVIAQYYGLGTAWHMVLLYCVVSGGLAWICYQYVEGLTFTGKRSIMAIGAVLFAVVFSVGYFDGNRIMFDKQTLKIANYKIKTDPFFAQYRKDTCFVESMKRFKKDPCLCFDPARKNVLLIGDSHMAMFSESLRDGFKDINFLQATAPATLPTIKSYYDKKNNLRPLMDFMYKDFIPHNYKNIDGVVLTANWAGQRLVAKEQHAEAVKEAVAYFKRYNIPVVVIGQTERYTVAYPVVAARNHQYGIMGNEFYLDGHTLAIDTFLAEKLKGIYVPMLNRSNFPELLGGGEPYMRDKDHLTKFGADLEVAKLKNDPIWKNFMEGVSQK